PIPYTDDELAACRRKAEACGCYTCKPQLRLCSTVDAERARREQVAAERDALRGMVRRYHDGWYIVSASAPLRDVWCKDHYPDDGYVTEELTSAEADAFRRALASPTEGNPE